ncbi:hypothetical protein IGB42_03003 [Andreprevotia sp. IGB-42]|uniref:hypothetical protein n=1 Tax=Andreprevotia sp. IGB-42 TaxID=2497473 RepID=UPI001357AA5A|nr:hypothetical protein [Andreprevotia sp. IGB-42]KAF0812711.1 hypothetical protein IGB42_03003 [Andreprevotia sp. IGB-42]
MRPAPDCKQPYWLLGKAGMKLYTFLLEFEDSTYASQVRAPSELEAAKVWCEQLMARNHIEGLDIYVLAELRASLNENFMAPLNGLEKIWRFSFQVDDVSGTGNVIETAVDPWLAASKVIH